MTNYKMQVEHAGYWRGKVHRWSTAWSFTGSVATGDIPTCITAMKALENAVCYKDPSSVNGGVAAINLYNEDTGGVPISSNTYFDWEDPLTWVPYTSLGWASRAWQAIQPLEPALLVEWSAGLSRTGKPVTFRKFFHAVAEENTEAAAPNISTDDVTGLEASINNELAIIGGKGLLLGRGSRLAATTCRVDTYYVAHQIPRGRRRKVVAVAGYTGPTTTIRPIVLD